MRKHRRVPILWPAVAVLIFSLALNSPSWAQKGDSPDKPPLETSQPTSSPNEKSEPPPASEPAAQPGVTPAPEGPPKETETSTPAPESAPPAQSPAITWDQAQLNYIKDLYDSSFAYQSGLLGMGFMAQRDPLLKYALAEIQVFLDDYPQSTLYPQVYLLMGDCYLKNGEPQKAAATFLVVLARFEQMPEGTIAKNRFEEALQKVDREERKNLSTLLGVFSHQTSEEMAYYVTLEGISKTPIIGLTAWLAEEWGRFARFYFNSERAPLALENMAQELLKVPDPQGAIMAYKKIIHFHPNSASAATAYFALGDIWRHPIKQPGKAISAYLDTVNQYPQDLRVEEALWKVSQVYHRDLKDYPKAVEAYQKLIDRFSDGAFTSKALWEMAVLYGDALDRPADAIKAYQRLQKDFPRDDRSPPALLRAGTLAEKELKDPGRAQGFYELLTREYPYSKEAEEAKKRLEKLKPKS